MAKYNSTANCTPLVGGNTSVEQCNSNATYDDMVYIMNGNALTAVTLSDCAAGNEITAIVDNTVAYPTPVAYTFEAAQKDGIKLTNDSKTDVTAGTTTVENELMLKMVSGVDSAAARCFTKSLQGGGNYVLFTEKCGKLYLILAEPKCATGAVSFSGLKASGKSSEKGQENNNRMYKFTAPNKEVEEYPLNAATELIVRTWIAEGLAP